MRALKYALLATLVFSGPALAADLAPQAVEPTPPVATAYNWTGFYAGGHIGDVWTSNKIRSASESEASLLASGVPLGSVGFPGILLSRSKSTLGVEGGVQAGYNYQLDQVVVGIEGDFDLTSGSYHSGADQDVDGSSVSTSWKDRSDWNGSIRARLGYALDSWLPYVTAGVGIRNDKFDGAVTWPSANPIGVPSTSVSKSTTQAGFVGGAGFEYALSDHWSVRGEGLYAWYPGHDMHAASSQNDDLGGGIVFATTTISSFKSTSQAASFDLGVNYRF